MQYPIECGTVEDWEQMEKVLAHGFDKLKVDAYDHNVLITEGPQTSKNDREKMTRMMFENLQVNGLYIAMSGLLSLYSYGRTTGLVVESGESSTHTTPVYEGFVIPYAVRKNFVSGRAITDHLINLL